MFANLPEEINNKIIMYIIPKYNYMDELKHINKVVMDESSSLLVEVKKRMIICCSCGYCQEKTWYAFYYSIHYDNSHVCFCSCRCHNIKVFEK